MRSMVKIERIVSFDIELSDDECTALLDLVTNGGIPDKQAIQQYLASLDIKSLKTLATLFNHVADSKNPENYRD